MASGQSENGGKKKANVKRFSFNLLQQSAPHNMGQHVLKFENMISYLSFGQIVHRKMNETRQQLVSEIQQERRIRLI